jgi:hypothetical protein
MLERTKSPDSSKQNQNKPQEKKAFVAKTVPSEEKYKPTKSSKAQPQYSVKVQDQ